MLTRYRELAREHRTASLFVHHRRKQSRKADESVRPLENAVLREWFQEARGASALINGTDMRLGVDAPDMGVMGKGDVAIVLRGFGRIRGEVGPLNLARMSMTLGIRPVIGCLRVRNSCSIRIEKRHWQRCHRSLHLSRRN